MENLSEICNILLLLSCKVDQRHISIKRFHENWKSNVCTFNRQLFFYQIIQIKLIKSFNLFEKVNKIHNKILEEFNEGFNKQLYELELSINILAYEISYAVSNFIIILTAFIILQAILMICLQV